MATDQQTAAAPSPPPRLISEWFWRFLAVVMLASAGWVVWVAYQLNPAPVATQAAFEAAASARASRNAKGVIAPSPDAAPKPEAAPAAAEAPKEPKEPPVNLEKLKLTDTIAAPVAEPTK